MFQIDFYDKDFLTIVHSTRTFRALELSDALNSVGFCNINTHPDDFPTSYIYQPHNIVFIYKVDISEKFLVWQGYIDKTYKTKESNGNKQLQITCRTFESILSRRVIDYDEESIEAAKSGPAYLVIESYFMQNIGNPTPTPVPGEPPPPPPDPYDGDYWTRVPPPWIPPPPPDESPEEEPWAKVPPPWYPGYPGDPYPPDDPAAPEEPTPPEDPVFVYHPDRRSGDGNIPILVFVRKVRDDLLTPFDKNNPENPIVSIYEDPDLGPFWSGDKSGEVLLSVIQEIVEASYEQGFPLDFKLRLEKDDNEDRLIYKFYLYQGAIGNYRSFDLIPEGEIPTNVPPFNSKGNVPLVFSYNYGNIEKEEEWKGGERRNALLVIGDAGVYFSFINSDDIDQYNITRYEAIINESSLTDLNDFASVAEENTITREDTHIVRFTPRFKEGSRYLYDFYLGDVIVYRDDNNVDYPFRVVAHKFNVDSDHSYSVDLTTSLYQLLTVYHYEEAY